MIYHWIAGQVGKGGRPYPENDWISGACNKPQKQGEGVARTGDRSSFPGHVCTLLQEFVEYLMLGYYVYSCRTLAEAWFFEDSIFDSWVVIFMENNSTPL